MSKAITAQIQADAAKAQPPDDYFTCTAHQAPECTGRGFFVGRDKATCSPCLNWQKREEAQRLEKADYSFVEKSR